MGHMLLMLDEKLHRQLKAKCGKDGFLMKDYVVDLIKKGVKEN